MIPMGDLLITKESLIKNIKDISKQLLITIETKFYLREHTTPVVYLSIRKRVCDICEDLLTEPVSIGSYYESISEVIQEIQKYGGNKSNIVMVRNFCIEIIGKFESILEYLLKLNDIVYEIQGYKQHVTVEESILMGDIDLAVEIYLKDCPNISRDDAYRFIYKRKGDLSC